MRMGAADQAKLLLFALLRSTATALATTGEKARLVVPPPSVNIQLRLATRTDVNSIQACNLACLPENYNAQFYASHLRQWPDLALVAEDVSGTAKDSSSNNNNLSVADQDRNPRFHFSSPYPNSLNSRSHPRQRAEPKIVAYVLGKVETRPVVDYENPLQNNNRVETLGHVTSLAVRDEYRRLGIAKSLMNQLHHHLYLHRGVEACGLHVRTSNQAACRLYQRDGYEVAQIIPSYYQDGEDAFFMRKRLEAPEGSATTQPPGSPLFGSVRGSVRRSVWKSGTGEMRLPRKHVVPADAETSSVTSSSSASSALEGDSVSSGASSVSYARDSNSRHHSSQQQQQHVGALLDQ